MEVTNLLRELDAYLLPNGKLVETTFHNLQNRYYPDAQREISEARTLFIAKSYIDIKEKLDMFSQPPVNVHAANIITKIKDYLNKQVLDMYT